MRAHVGFSAETYSIIEEIEKVEKVGPVDEDNKVVLKRIFC